MYLPICQCWAGLPTCCLFLSYQRPSDQKNPFRSCPPSPPEASSPWLLLPPPFSGLSSNVTISEGPFLSTYLVSHRSPAQPHPHTAVSLYFFRAHTGVGFICALYWSPSLLCVSPIRTLGPRLPPHAPAWDRAWHTAQRQSVFLDSVTAVSLGAPPATGRPLPPEAGLEARASSLTIADCTPSSLLSPDADRSPALP